MTSKNLTPHSQEIDKDYQSLLQEIKSIISTGQFQAYKAVDNIKVQTYWQVGERIVREELTHKDRADYGVFLIQNLSTDLSIDKRELYRIVKFYRLYEIVATLSPQLSWSHYENLIELEEQKQRSFYQNKAVLHSWSVRELRKQIKNNLYENTSPQEIEEIFKTKLPTITNQEIFKSDLDLGFIELHPADQEKHLEEKLMHNIKKFLKELGEDFAFLDNQAPIKIDGKTHFIDLVLFHLGIPCYVLVELKIGKFDDSVVGQMNKYITYYRQHRQYDYQQDTIGLIICQEAGKEEVFYTLGKLKEDIFVAKYKTKLPSENKIKKAIKSNI